MKGGKRKIGAACDNSQSGLGRGGQGARPGAMPKHRVGRATQESAFQASLDSWSSCIGRAGAWLALCVLVVAGGCPGLLAPQMDPVRWQCKMLVSADPAARREALEFLHHEFVDEHWTKYKFATDAHRRELGTCMAGLARLLDDPDSAIRRRARQTMGGLSFHTAFWRRPSSEAREVVQALLQDAERLWEGADLAPDEAEDRAILLARDLEILSAYGPAAKPALPLVETILAAPDLPLEAEREPGAPLSAFPPLPPPCALPDPFGEDGAPPTVQQSAAELKRSIGGREGPCFVDR